MCTRTKKDVTMKYPVRRRREKKGLVLLKKINIYLWYISNHCFYKNFPYFGDIEFLVCTFSFLFLILFSFLFFFFSLSIVFPNFSCSQLYFLPAFADFECKMKVHPILKEKMNHGFPYFSDTMKMISIS